MTPSEVRERDVQRLLAILQSEGQNQESELDNSAQNLLNILQNGENSGAEPSIREIQREKATKRAEKRQKMTQVRQIVNSVDFTGPNRRLSKNERFVAIAEMRRLGKSWD